MFWQPIAQQHTGITINLEVCSLKTKLYVNYEYIYLCISLLKDGLLLGLQVRFNNIYFVAEFGITSFYAQKLMVATVVYLLTFSLLFSFNFQYIFVYSYVLLNCSIKHDDDYVSTDYKNQLQRRCSVGRILTFDTHELWRKYTKMWCLYRNYRWSWQLTAREQEEGCGPTLTVCFDETTVNDPNILLTISSICINLSAFIPVLNVLLLFTLQ